MKNHLALQFRMEDDILALPFVQVQVKERPPMHEYMRRLLYKDLSKTTTEKVLRQMRKLPWDESGVSFNNS